MRKLYTIMYIVMLVCVVGTVIFLILAPDRIPVHYDFAGEADRFGSKYENLLWPLFAVGLGGFFLLMAGRARKTADKTNEKALVIAGACTLSFFTLLGFFLMRKALRYDPEAAHRVSVYDVNRFVSIGIGALLVMLGNLMPKARRNSLFGLRTKWSMANDSVWRKSQRFGGITVVAAGFVMMILSLFIPGIWNILMQTVVILAAVILCLTASCRYYRADREGEEKRRGPY